jgi:hypothetical protein
VRLRVLAAAAALAVTVAVLPTPARPEGFALIRNARNTRSTLTRGQLKEIALGKRKTWPHGPVAVLVLPRPGTPELAWFASSAIGVPEDVLLARIREQVFKGEMRKPISAATDQDALAAVASEVGTIGVVRDELAKKLPDGVALLTLQ